METLLTALVLLIFGAAVYYAPLFNPNTIVEIEGVEYHLSKGKDLKVLVRFKLDGVEFSHTRKFDDATLRDEWIKMFDKRVADNIKFIATGDVRYKGIRLPELKKGKALVIAGAQGSGKSVAARNIAENSKLPYCVVTEHALTHKFMPDYMVESKIWIVDEPYSSEGLSLIKSIATSDEIVVQRQGFEAKLTPSPQIILCVSDGSRFKDSRRFEVLQL